MMNLTSSGILEPRASDGGIGMAGGLWLTDTVPSERFPLYTRLNANDVLPDPVTPLGATPLEGYPRRPSGRCKWSQALPDNPTSARNTTMPKRLAGKL